MLDRLFLTCCLLCLAIVGPARGDEPSEAASIATAIEELGSDRYITREEASAYLWDVGEPARAAIEKAARSSDPEVRLRAKELLANLDAGVRPNTPPSLANTLRRYQSASQEERGEILNRLREQKQYEPLLTLLRQEPDDGVRSRHLSGLLNDRGALAAMLANEQTEEVERLMQFAALSPGHFEKFVTYAVLTGKLEAAVAVRAKPKSNADRLLLAQLLRAQGDSQGALQVLREAPRPQDFKSLAVEYRTVEAELLQSTGDWAAMAQIVDHETIKGVDCETKIELLGQSAFCNRLAGNQARFDQCIAEIKSEGLKPDERWFAIEALLVNDRHADAIEIASATSVPMAFELLTEQLRYADALELVQWDRHHSAREWYAARKNAQPGGDGRSNLPQQVAIPLASLLLRLGETQAARDLFAILVEESREDTPALAQIVRVERRLNEPGWRAHALTALDFAKGANREPTKPPFTTIVGSPAPVWWGLLRSRYPQDSPAQTIERLDLLVNPRWAGSKLPDESRAMLLTVLQSIERTKIDESLPTLQAIADLGRFRGDRELADRTLQLQFEFKPNDLTRLKLADADAASARWEFAATHYRGLWDTTKNRLALYLHGVALAKLGKAADADKAIRLARLLALAEDDNERARFVRGLQERGLTREALAECELTRRVRTSWDADLRDALLNLANAELADHPLVAAQFGERVRQQALRTESSFSSTNDFFELSSVIHRSKAIGLLAEGFPDQAFDAAQLAIDARPANIDVAIHLIKVFENADHEELARRLFESVEGNLQRLIAEFPQAAHLHNGMAWLLVKTDRQSDDALEHARLAVERTPDDPAPIDTLALVLHKRGEHREAADMARRCVALAPGVRHFQQQLSEFEQSLRDAANEE